MSRGTCLGSLQPVDVVEPSTSAPYGSLRTAPCTASASASAPIPASKADTSAADVTSSLMEKLPDDLTGDQLFQVQQLLQGYDDMFSHGAFDMGRTTLVEHSIDTGSQRPIRQGLRRHPVAHLDTIDEQVEELIRNDFVEPAASPWASNVVLVRKKDSSHRLCVDY